MLNGKKIIVVMPAYNAEKTLETTYREVPLEVVDEVILVDDASRDRTAEISRSLGIQTVIHSKNKGYGGNQKTCYKTAIERGADIVVMLHPDYQYTPKLITAMAGMLAYNVYDAVFGSRILAQKPLQGGMPLYKYVANRALTAAQNILMGQKFSEYHSGFRAFTKESLKQLPLEENSDDFIFDNEMITQLCFFGFRCGEISCPTKYFAEASSINLSRSIKYGFGCLWNSVLYFTAKNGVFRPRFLESSGRKLGQVEASALTFLK